MAHDLKKKFGDLAAVSGVSFTIEGGSHGFLGPNGAGKTTLMRMIATLSPITSGSLYIDNNDVNYHHEDIKSIIGLVPQFDNLDPDLTVFYNLLVYARFFSIKRKEAKRRAKGLIDFMHLSEKSDLLPQQLSGGMRRRLLIARALINDPKILILDEPTAGLDPMIKRQIWQKLKELKDKGITLLITTHDMQEGEVLCDEVFVIDRGIIIARGRPSELIEQTVGIYAIEIALRPVDKIEGVIHGQATIYPRADSLVITTNDHNVIQKLNTEYNADNPTVRKANLEDVFLALTGREVS